MQDRKLVKERMPTPQRLLIIEFKQKQKLTLFLLQLPIAEGPIAGLEFIKQSGQEIHFAASDSLSVKPYKPLCVCCVFSVLQRPFIEDYLLIISSLFVLRHFCLFAPDNTLSTYKKQNG